MAELRDKDLQLVHDLTLEQQRLAAELQQILTNTKKLGLDLRTDQKCGEAWYKTKLKWQSFLKNHASLKEAAPADIAYFSSNKIMVAKRIVIAIQDVVKKMDPLGSYEVPGGPLINVLEDVEIPENPEGDVDTEDSEEEALVPGAIGGETLDLVQPISELVDKRSGTILKLPLQDLDGANSIEEDQTKELGGGKHLLESTVTRTLKPGQEKKQPDPPFESYRDQNNQRDGLPPRGPLYDDRQQQTLRNPNFGYNEQQNFHFIDGIQNRAHHGQWMGQMSSNGSYFNPQPPQQPPVMDWITRLVTGMNQNNQEIITQLQGQPRNPATDHGRGLQIPKMEVPLFDGNTKKFRCFRDTWDTIIETSSLSGLEKLAFLKSRLTGRALESIDHLDICAENYPEAWEVLVERFDNARVLFEDEWASLRALPSLNGNNPDEFMQMSESIKHIFANIRSMGTDPYSGPQFAAATIIKKFDRVTRNKFEESLIDPKAVVQMKTVQDFLKRRYLEVLAQRTTYVWDRVLTPPKK